MNFYRLLKILARTQVISIVKNLLIVLKKSVTHAIKTASKRAIQKTAEVTGDLIGNKIADKITRASKKYPKEFHSKELPSNNAINEIAKERYISPQGRKQIIDELRLM